MENTYQNETTELKLKNMKEPKKPLNFHQPLTISDISKVYKVPPILLSQHSTPQHLKLPTLTSSPSFAPDPSSSPTQSPSPSTDEPSAAVLASSLNRMTKRDLGQDMFLTTLKHKEVEF